MNLLYKKCEVCETKINKLQHWWYLYTLKAGSKLKCQSCNTEYKTNKFIGFSFRVYLLFGLWILPILFVGNFLNSFESNIGWQVWLYTIILYNLIEFMVMVILPLNKVKKMEFINEYVSKEDIEKYKIFELMEHYKERSMSEKDRKDFILYWVINKQRDIWFKFITDVMNPDWDYMQGSGEKIWILHYKGTNIEVRLFDPPDEGSISFKEKPYIKIWKLLSIKPESLEDISNKKLKKLIKEALIVHGDQGMFSSISQN
ncbi:hypothetical protein CRU99_13265, partial [Malaciobacter mytili]|uniref:hypothetical protein n=1 Tax=Malaciobacter mytili TaxID=603050 RepID=UPI00100C2134